MRQTAKLLFDGVSLRHARRSGPPPAAEPALSDEPVILEYDDAALHLQWVQKRQKDELLQAITAQRLAVVYLQQQKYDDALKALDAKVSDDLKPVLLETRGDVLVAQGKPKEAAAAYEAALKLLPEDAPQRELLQMKAEPLS